MQEAATGTIVNGSVTKEKLAAALLARIYGGLAWVSADTPDSGDNPDTDFPLGHVWVRPSFSVSNDAGETWSATGCTAGKSGNDVTITGLAQVASVKASQSLTGIGNQGDRVRILFSVKNQDSEMTSLIAAVNGVTQDISGDVVLNSVLSANGSLTVEIYASWPSTSLADGSVTLANYTVVNLDKIMRQMAGAREIDDWNAWLQSIIPFTNYKSPLAVFSQEKAGVWTQTAYDVLPVSRGGTGLSALVPNRYLKTTPSGEIGFYGDDDMISDLSAEGFLRSKSGQYSGDETERTIELGVSPLSLTINPGFTTIHQEQSISINHEKTWTSGSIEYGCGWNTGVTLNGSKLTIWKSDAYRVGTTRLKDISTADMWNNVGTTYKWTAIY